MTENAIDRKSVTDSRFREILEREGHHDHAIIKDGNGTLRWKANPRVEKILTVLDIEGITTLLWTLGYDRNSEVYRKLYRDMGYSLEGYWEEFYWVIRNREAGRYQPGEGMPAISVFLVPIGRAKPEDKVNP